jgi:hypothetical protein
MIVAGLGEGALITLLFNVLVSASPRELAGDVGSVRGTTNNLAAGVGTALAGALLVGVLGSSIYRELADNSTIPIELRNQVDLDAISFKSNAELRRALASVEGAEAHIDEAVQINTQARLVALKATFLALAALSLLAYFPAGGLPSSR